MGKARTPTTKEERQDAALNKRLNNVTLLERRQVLVLPKDWEDMTGPERETTMASMLASGWESAVALIPKGEGANENEGVREEAHVADWMEETNFVGTVMAYRRVNFGPDKDGRITRSERRTMKIA